MFESDRVSGLLLSLFLLLVGPHGVQAQGIPGHTLQENVVVPVSGTVVTSTTSLDAGVSYKIRASGTMQIAPDPLFADAEYARFSDPIDNTVTGNVDLGIGIDDTANDADKFPVWGPYDASHVYVINLGGQDAAIGLNFHDSFYPDNSGSLGVDIFAPAPNAEWSAAFPLQVVSSGPAILVGFNSLGDAAVLDLSDPFLAEINAAFGGEPIPFLQLNLAAYGALTVPPTPILPTVTGNRLDFPLDDGDGTTATVRIEFSSTGGEQVEEAGLAEFEPLPTPPSSGLVGFNPQPEPPVPGYQSLLVPFESGALSLGPGPGTLTMTVEILDAGGTPMAMVLATPSLPLLAPWGLLAIVAAVGASGITFARRRQAA